MRIETGSDAAGLLQSDDFLDRWNELWDACPWATLFQSPSFTCIWYDVYSSSFQPAIIFDSNSQNDLTGLLLLAESTVDGTLSCVGSHHAEYDTWLSRPTTSNDFIVRALSTCAEHYPSEKRLRFLFLAPGTPISWADSFSHPTLTFSVRSHKRHQITLSDVSSIQNSLEKSGNRSKLNRMKRRGPLELKRLTTRTKLEQHIDQIAALTDIRQGAINASLPFRSDLRKREFYLRLSEDPDLIHVSLLTVGDSIAAAHLGPVNKDSICLGLITHSPIFADNSPGKFLIYKLALRLADEGFHFLDLTPGGEYKQRYADETDEVFVLEVFLSKLEATKYKVKSQLGRYVRSAAHTVGIEADNLQERATRWLDAPRVIANKGLGRALRSTVRRLANRLWSTSTQQIFALETSNVDWDVINHAITDCSMSIVRNDFQQLAAFRRAASDGKDVADFFQECLAQLSEGEFIYTAADEHQLVHYAWRSPEREEIGSDFGHRIGISEPVSVLHDAFTFPEARGLGLHKASLAMRIRDAVQEEDVNLILSGVREQNDISRRNCERFGFRPIGSVGQDYRFLRRNRWFTETEAGEVTFANRRS